MVFQLSFQMIIVLLVLTVLAGIFIAFLTSAPARGGLSMDTFVVFLCDTFYALLGPSCGTVGLAVAGS